MNIYEFKKILEQHKLDLEKCLETDPSPYKPEMDLSETKYNEIIDKARISTMENLKRVIKEIQDLPNSF